jgi:general secretion pathway protein L
MSSVIGSVRSGLSALWSWWLAELAGMLPRRLKRVARRDRRQIVLLLNSDETIVLERTDDRARVVGVANEDQNERDRQLAPLLKRVNQRRQPVTICLGDQLGLRKVIGLPLAARDDLEQLLRFEMDRLTPFRAEDVYFAHRIVDTDTANRRITVELAVAPRSIVEQALKTARTLGVAAARVELRPTRPEGREPLNLLPQEAADAAGQRRLIRALVLLALILATVAVTIPLLWQRATLAALTEQVAATRIEAEQSHALREQLDQLTQMGRFLLAEKGRRPMATEALADLTRLMPDQAYLAQLTLQGGEVQLHGWAMTASDLISLLDQSPLFRAPQFRSPVTQDGSDGAERFHLSVELVEGG